MFPIMEISKTLYLITYWQGTYGAQVPLRILEMNPSAALGTEKMFVSCNDPKNSVGRQGLSQDLDSRVSKMDFGGDRVSW